MAEITEAATEFAPLIKSLQVEGGAVVGYLLTWPTAAGEQIRHYHTDKMELADIGLEIRTTDLACMTPGTPEHAQCSQDIEILSA